MIVGVSGQLALLMALFFALMQAMLPVVAQLNHHRAFYPITRGCARAQFIWVLIAYGLLSYAFVTNDFSIAYVAENDHSQLPLFYKIAAVWGAHEGSMLLWLMILNVWTLLVSLKRSALPEYFHARVLSVLGFVSFGFLLFIILTSSPFAHLLVVPLKEGLDLNPLLQDPGLVSHPPMLYMGYVGFSVSFAYALAGLWSLRLEKDWISKMAPWTLAAWFFLSFGILLGALWSYRVLGWGGYWAWDPVENASFLPWLVGTALIHAFLIHRKKDHLQAWTIFLAILCFSLSLLGTFLVRSGVLVSVHAFAQDPLRGEAMFILLMVVLCASLSLFALRAPKMHSHDAMDFFSKEGSLLLNHIMMVVMCLTVLIGTIYPIILDALGLEKLSIGAAYYNLIMSILTIPALWFMTLSLYFTWHKSQLLRFKPILMDMAISVVLMVLLYGYLDHAFSIWQIVLLYSAITLLVATLKDGYHRYRRRSQSMRAFAMIIAHIAMAVLILGIVLNSQLSQTRTVEIQQGESVDLGPYQLIISAHSQVEGPNYHAKQLHIQVRGSKDKLISNIYPQKRFFAGQDNQGIAKSVIIHQGLSDLYVVYADTLKNGHFVLRLYYKAYIQLVWLSGLLVLISALWAFIARREKRRK